MTSECQTKDNVSSLPSLSSIPIACQAPCRRSASPPAKASPQRTLAKEFVRSVFSSGSSTKSTAVPHENSFRTNSHTRSQFPVPQIARLRCGGNLIYAFRNSQNKKYSPIFYRKYHLSADSEGSVPSALPKRNATAIARIRRLAIIDYYLFSTADPSARFVTMTFPSPDGKVRRQRPPLITE